MGDWTIPIYNKNSYIIRIDAPKGYIFSMLFVLTFDTIFYVLGPKEVSITIDGKTDKCSIGEDINFALTAFEISGRVRSGDHDGPSSLNLALYSASDNTIIASTTTDKAGSYSFEAAPG